jgi:hypothetical protein
MSRDEQFIVAAIGFFRGMVSGAIEHDMTLDQLDGVLFRENLPAQMYEGIFGRAPPNQPA